jgi:type II secretory pathway pseudopilin PulG
MPRRRGYNIIELTVATVILVAVMGVSLKWFVATARQRRAADCRQAALREAANAMERLAARPWEELTPEGVSKLATSLPPDPSLPGGQVLAEVKGPGGEPEGKFLTVTVRWRPRAEAPPEQVRLVAWKYRRKT